MKQILLSGSDLGEVILPSGPEERQKALDFLWENRYGFSGRVNMSQVRKAEQREELPLFSTLADRETGQTRLYWNGFAGTIHREAGDWEITVKLGSQFDTGEGQPYFLLAMLLNWLDGDLPVLLDDRVAVSGEEIFPVFWAAVFKVQLLRAYSTGAYKTYQYFEDNSHRIRGQIDIQRHVRLNLGLNNGRIATKYRENTTDNHMNHLILHTYQELKRRWPDMTVSVIDGDAQAKDILAALGYQAPSYGRYDVRTVAARLQNPISHPFFTGYEALRKVCLAFLSYAGVPVFDSGDAGEFQTQSVLFYTPDLWEAYIEKRVLPKIGLEGLTWDAQIRGRDFGSIADKRPDFVLYLHRGTSREKRVVLDAKYKKKWRNFPEDTGNLQEDICQCLVYKELLRAELAGTIFPTKAPGGSCRGAAVSDYDPRKDAGGSFRAIGLGIPAPGEGESFAHWNRRMEKMAGEAAGRIRQMLQSIEE